MGEPPKLFYRRKLPHIHPPGDTLFVTFRLAGTLPRELVLRWQEEYAIREAELRANPPGGKLQEALLAEQKRQFARVDAALGKALHGPAWLKRPEIARLVEQALHELDKHELDVIAYCIMPNHVHFVATLLTDTPFHRTMQLLKGRSARAINKVLQQQGRLWQREYYDYVARNGAELKRIVSYVLENPVKAGLCEDWEQWPFSYWKEE